MSYLLALAALLAAVLLRLLLDPVMGDRLPLVTLFGAVAAAAWVGGFRPAALVAILGYVACAYLFLPPRGQLSGANLGDMVGLVAYLVTCGLIIAFGEVTRIAQIRESEQRELLRVTLHSIGDAVITTDIGNRITHLNTVAEAVTGWTQRDAVGTAARQRVSCHQRRNSPAGGKPRHKGRSVKEPSSAWRITRC